MVSGLATLRRFFRTALFISVSLIAGLFLYAVLVELVRSQLRPFPGFLPGPHLQSLRIAFYGAAIGCTILVRVCAKALTRPDPGEDVLHLGQRLTRSAVIAGTLAELPAVLGFALFLLSGSSRDFSPLFVVSLFLEIMVFPRFEVWQALAKTGPTREGPEEDK